jgi:PAS domain S-box-containing protein
MDDKNNIIKKLQQEIKTLHKEIADIRESAHRFRQLFENISSGVVVYKAVDEGNDFIILDINYSAEQMEEVIRDQCIGKKVTEVFPGVVAFGLLKVFYEVWKSGKPQKDPISFYEDGRIKGWRENYVYKISGDEIVAVFDDLTEKMVIEEEMSRLVDIIESTSDLVSTSTTDGKVSYLNLQGKKMLGWENIDISEKTIPDVHPKWASEYILREGLLVAIEKGRWVGETAIIHTNGEEIPVSQVIMVHYNNDGSPNYYSTIMRDITERNKNENQLN